MIDQSYNNYVIKNTFGKSDEKIETDTNSKIQTQIGYAIQQVEKDLADTIADRGVEPNRVPPIQYN